MVPADDPGLLCGLLLMAILGQEVPKSLIFALFIFLQALFPPVCCPNLRKVYLVMVLMVSAATAYTNTWMNHISKPNIRNRTTSEDRLLLNRREVASPKIKTRNIVTWPRNTASLFLIRPLLPVFNNDNRKLQKLFDNKTSELLPQLNAP